MKQIVNTKKILKTTIALSALVLVGCSANNAESYNYDDQYVYFDAYTAPQDNSEISIEEEIVVVEEKANTPAKVETKTKMQKATPRSVAASSPAKPRVVPVKPEKTCIGGNCPSQVKTSTSKTSVSTATVKEKPQSKSNIAKEEVTQNEVVAPIVNKTIEDKTSKAKANTKEKDIAVVNKMTTEDTFVVLDLDANTPNINVLKNATEEVLEKDKVVSKTENTKKEASNEKKEAEVLEQQSDASEKEIKITQIPKNTLSSCDDVKDWVAAEGTTLRSLLLEWGNIVGWRVVWNMDRDYTLEAGAIFRGRFVDVAAALLRSFARATPAPKGVFYKGNKVLVISTREDENAD